MIDWLPFYVLLTLYDMIRGSATMALMPHEIPRFASMSGCSAALHQPSPCNTLSTRPAWRTLGTTPCSSCT